MSKKAEDITWKMTFNYKSYSDWCEGSMHRKKGMTVHSEKDKVLMKGSPQNIFSQVLDAFRLSPSWCDL